MLFVCLFRRKDQKDIDIGKLRAQLDEGLFTHLLVDMGREIKYK